MGIKWILSDLNYNNILYENLWNHCIYCCCRLCCHLCCPQPQRIIHQWIIFPRHPHWWSRKSFHLILCQISQNFWNQRRIRIQTCPIRTNLPQRHEPQHVELSQQLHLNHQQVRWHDPSWIQDDARIQPRSQKRQQSSHHPQHHWSPSFSWLENPKCCYPS